LGLFICSSFLSACISYKNGTNKSLQLNYADAHTHLTIYGEAAIDSLNAYGITTVRDCGGDITLLKKWRDEINSGKRKGPKIYFAGPMIDGRSEYPIRIGVYTIEQARLAVDSLAFLGVDFIKTHTNISPECYFAVLREAKAKNLKVVSHLPHKVPVWVAADSGVNCVEHAAESILASPINAGYAKTIDEAIAWWRSSKGDSIITQLGKLKIYFTPTLIAYKTFALNGTSQQEIDSRFKVLEFLKEITFKLNKAGVIILAGSDFAKPPPSPWQEIPGKSLFQEIEMLEQAGLTKQEAINAATNNLQSWLKQKGSR
jgi:hypothetical protein